MVAGRRTRLERCDIAARTFAAIYTRLKHTRGRVFDDQDFVFCLAHMRALEQALKHPCAECLNYPEGHDG
jgi:hypothetical protein